MALPIEIDLEKVDAANFYYVTDLVGQCDSESNPEQIWIIDTNSF